MTDDRVAMIMGFLTIILFAVFGVACTFFPLRVQKIVTRERFGGLRNLSMQIGPVRRYIESPQYVLAIRLIGIMALVSTAVIIWAVARTTLSG
jgi:hypothetical protein